MIRYPNPTPAAIQIDRADDTSDFVWLEIWHDPSLRFQPIPAPRYCRFVRGAGLGNRHFVCVMTRYSIQFLPTWPGTAWVDDQRRAGQWCVVIDSNWDASRPVEYAVVFNAPTFDECLDYIRAQPNG
jgi:hypothetical protein